MLLTMPRPKFRPPIRPWQIGRLSDREKTASPKPSRMKRRSITITSTAPSGMSLLPEDLWDEIFAAQWRGIANGDASSYEALPDVAALASCCRSAHNALRRFMTLRRDWFDRLRERAGELCANGHLHAAEAHLELHLFGCHVLLGGRSPRTIAALDGLARLKIVLGRDAEESMHLVGETLGACAGGVVASCGTLAVEWEMEPARSIGDLERTRCLLELSAADSLVLLMTTQGRADEARGATSLRDGHVLRLLGLANLDVSAMAEPQTHAAAFLDSSWKAIDALLVSGMVGAAEVLARALDALGRHVLGASHPATLHMTHLLIQALRQQGRFAEVTPLAIEAERLWRERADLLFATDGDEERLAAAMVVLDGDGVGAQGGSALDASYSERHEAAAQLYIATSTLLSLLSPDSAETLAQRDGLNARVAIWLHRSLGRQAGENAPAAAIPGSLADAMAKVVTASLQTVAGSSEGPLLAN